MSDTVTKSTDHRSGAAFEGVYRLRVASIGFTAYGLGSTARSPHTKP